MSNRSTFEAGVARVLWDGEARFPELTGARELIERRLRSRGLEDFPEGDTSHRADLYLAAACLEGVAPAFELLERDVLHPVRGSVQRILRTESPDDLLQDLRRKLLVAVEGAEPKLKNYRGEGPLVSWVRAIAVRMAVESRAKQRNAEEEEDSDDLRAVGGDLELQLLKARHGKDFKAAFAVALAQLPSRARAMLRLHFVEGVSLELIGKLYGVHKSTISRQLTQTRASLGAALRARLSEVLHLEPKEVDSLLDAIHSQLSISMPRQSEAEGDRPTLAADQLPKVGA